MTLDHADIVLQRTLMERDFASLAHHAPVMANERSDTLAADGIKVKTLTVTPKSCRSETPHVFLHGGAWIKGSSLASLALIRRMADHCKRPILSLDYPLAPEAPYPAAITATRAALGILAGTDGFADTGGFAGLIGASAGCHVALGALLAQRQQEQAWSTAGLLLWNPALSMQTDSWSHRAFGKGFGLTSADMKAATTVYAVPFSDPLRDIPSMDLSGLPPVWIACGDRDPLLDDSMRAFAKFTECGCDAHLEIMPGGLHGFMNHWFASKRVDEMIGTGLDWLESRTEET